MRRSLSTGPSGTTIAMRGKRISGEGVFDVTSEVKAERLGVLLAAHWQGYKDRKMYAVLRSELSLSPYFNPKYIRETIMHTKGSILRTQRQYTYTSGGVYSGEWRGGFRDGAGEMQWPDGSRFIGKWSWGWPVGIGRFEGQEGAVYEGKWGSPFDVGRVSWCLVSASSLSAWTSSQSNGYLWLWYRDRRKDAPAPPASLDQTLAQFEGQFSRLKAMLATLRPRLEGELHTSELGNAGLRTMRQVRTDSGAVYTGELIGDIKDGSGRLVSSNGDFYQGEWKNNLRSGIGMSRWRDGSHYLGCFWNDKRTGPGEYYASDGSVYTGEWSGDVMSGLGMYTWEDGRSYFGQWKAGLQDGVGKMTNRDGSIAKGVWKDGKKSGVFVVSGQGRTRSEQWQAGRRVSVDKWN